MEVFAKRNLDLNATDLACSPVNLTTQVNTQVLKDDVWFPENRQDDVKSMFVHSPRPPDSFTGQAPFTTDLPLTAEKKAQRGDRGHGEGFACLSGLPQRADENL